MKRIFCLLILIISLISCKKEKPLTIEEMQENSGIPVSVVQAVQKDIKETVPASGDIMVDRDVVITRELVGEVLDVFVDEGDTVTTGQVLMQIDPRDYADTVNSLSASISGLDSQIQSAYLQYGLSKVEVNTRINQAIQRRESAYAQLLQAQSAMASAQSRLEELTTGLRPQEIEQARQQLEQATANYNKAEADYNRAKLLYEEGAIAKQDLESAETHFLVAKSQMNSAASGYELAKEGSRKEEIEIARQNLKGAKEGVKLANSQYIQAKEEEKLAYAQKSLIDIQYQQIRALEEQKKQLSSQLSTASRKLQLTRVTSPIDGAVVEKFVNKGDRIAGLSSPLFRIIDLSSIYFRAKISEKDINNIKVKQTAEIRIDAIPGKVFEGYIEELIPSAALTTRQFEVKIRFLPDPALKELRESMYARGEIIIREIKDALLLPKECIVRQNGKSFVYVVNNNKAHLKEVTPGIEVGENIEIKKGINIKDYVILKGAYYVEDGSKVKVMGGGGG